MRAAAIFCVVSDYGILFLSFTFFLNCFHLAFGDELVVCAESTGVMYVIRDFCTFV